MDIAYKLKNIIIVLVIFLLLSLIFNINSKAATFSITPAAESFSIGCSNSIDVMIDVTGQSANAAELEITYDPTQINIIDQNSSVSGVQVAQGDAFNAYFVNSVDTSLGKIKLAGANFFSNITSQKLVATITFTPLPGSTASTFTTLFTGVGNTTDSNIADSTTNDDILTGVTNSSYTYYVGACATDTQRPGIEFTNPSQGQRDVALDSNLAITITDNLSGVDLSRVEFIVNGIKYVPGNPEVILSGTYLNYTFVVNPAQNFPAGEAVTVTVNASDNSLNSRTSNLIFNQPEAPLPPPAPQTDTQPPVITFINPTHLETGVTTEEEFIFRITDNSSFDVDTLEVNLNNEIYTIADTELTSTGTDDDIEYTLIPRLPINTFGLNIFTVKGSDTSGNDFEKTILFNLPSDGSSPGECPVGEDTTIDPPFFFPYDQAECEYFFVTPRTTQAVQNLLQGDDQILKGTIFEDTFVEDAVAESGITSLSSITIAFLLLTNVLPFLAAPGLLLQYIVIIFGKRRKDPWGVITDLSNGKPIAFAVCQLYLKGSNYKISQTVSDLQGRYSFINDAGEYRLEVSQSGYKKFTKDISIGKDTKRQNIDIRLLSLDKEAGYSQDFREKVFSIIKKVYSKSLNYLFVIGLISSVVAFLISRSLLNTAFVIFYSIILIAIYNSRKNVYQGKSSVVDSVTKFRIPYAQIKIYDSNTLKLVDSIITNIAGYFDYFGAEGDYLILVVARGYKFPGKSNTLPLSKKGYNSMVSVHLTQGNNLISLIVDPIDFSDGTDAPKQRLESPFGASKRKKASFGTMSSKG